MSVGGFFNDYFRTLVPHIPGQQEYGGLLEGLFGTPSPLNITPQVGTLPGESSGAFNPQRAGMLAQNEASAAPGALPSNGLTAKILGALPPSLGMPLALRAAQGVVGSDAATQSNNAALAGARKPDGSVDILKLLLGAGDYSSAATYQRGIAQDQQKQNSADIATLDQGSQDIAKAMTPTDVGALGSSAPGLSWAQRLGLNNQEQQKAYQQTPGYKAQVAGAEADARVNAEQGGAQSLNPDAIDYVAQQYMINGQLPPLGMGKDAARMRQQIISRASEIEKETGATGADAAQRHAANKANTSALGRVTGAETMIGSFEQTAQKNADMALSLLDKGSAKSGIPVLNAWIQAGRRSVAGDPDVSAFDTALTTFKNEYARVVNSATGGGVTTDSARQEIEHILNAAQTPDQVRAAIKTAKADMANRTASLAEARTNLGSTIRGSAGAKPTVPAGGGSIDDLVNKYRTKR